MAHTQKNTQNNTKTRKTPRRNNYSEKKLFTVRLVWKDLFCSMLDFKHFNTCI